jgi:hypothetical protein
MSAAVTPIFAPKTLSAKTTADHSPVLATSDTLVIVAPISTNAKLVSTIVPKTKFAVTIKEAMTASVTSAFQETRQAYVQTSTNAATVSTGAAAMQFAAIRLGPTIVPALEDSVEMAFNVRTSTNVAPDRTTALPKKTEASARTKSVPTPATVKTATTATDLFAQTLTNATLDSTIVTTGPTASTLSVRLSAHVIPVTYLMNGVAVSMTTNAPTTLINAPSSPLVSTWSVTTSAPVPPVSSKVTVTASTSMNVSAVITCAVANMNTAATNLAPTHANVTLVGT